MNEKEGQGQFLRLLHIDREIRAGKFPAIRQLAHELEVSKRTIERDIEFLRDRYSAPVEYDYRRRGYTYTQPAFFLKSLFLTNEEFFSVAVFEKVLRQYRNTPLEAQLKGVFAKLTALLPEKTVSFNTLWVDEAVSFIAEPAPEIDPEIFSAVFAGVKTCHAVRFLYRSLGQAESAERSCEPYHIVCQRGAWYVIGRCRLKKELRIFSFSRMQRIELLTAEEPFTVPEDFSPQACIDTHVGVWLNKREPFTVRLLFAPAVRAFAEEHIWNADQTVSVRKDGWVEVRFETTQFEEIKRFVLGQGTTVRILEPQELVESVQEEIRQMSGMYEET
ncbi:MAG: helix-turn-helix transcriptional regulator [Treponema sp.]